MNHNTFYNFLNSRVKKHKSKLIFQRKDGWSWKQITWQDFEAEIKNISCFLIDLGFQKNNPVITYSANTLECLIFELAVYLLGGITIPVQNTEHIRNILEKTDDNFFIFADSKENLDSINNSYGDRLIKCFLLTDENLDIEQGYVNYKNLTKFGAIKRKKLNDELKQKAESVSSDSTATIFYKFNGNANPDIVRFSQEKILNLMNIIQKKIKFITEENQTYSFLPAHDSFSKFANLLNIQIGNRGAMASNPDEFFVDILEVMPNIIYLSESQLQKIMKNLNFSSNGSLKDNLGGKLKYIITDTTPGDTIKTDLIKNGINVIELNQLALVD